MGHTTKIGNFSVASVEFSVDSGTNIAATQSTATLTLIPDEGFTITASDFSYTSGPSQVDSVTFAQSGNNVIATVTFATDAIMPSSDLNIPLCISGDSGLVSFSLAGNIEVIASSNVTPTSGNIAYTATGNYGDEVEVFSQTISANSNYYFPNEPTGNLTSGNSSQYEFTTSKTVDNAGLITSKTFTGIYTFSNNNVTGDVFTIVADAVAIPSITREITNYSINKTNIDPDGETRTMVIYGVEGAQFSLTAVNEDGTSVLTAPLTNITIPGSGSYSFNIVFPSVTDTDDYDFVLTGDLASPFPQDTTFTINQYVDITLGFGLTTTDSNITVPSNYNIVYAANNVLSSTDLNYNFTATLTATSTSTLAETTAPQISDLTNLDSATNGGTDVTISSVTSSVAVDGLSYTVTITGVTNETGTLDVLSALNLNNHITTNTAPVANAGNFSVSKGASETVTLSASDADLDNLDYIIVSLPSNGTLYTDTGLTDPITSGEIPYTLAANTVYYEHDDSSNLTDSFTFKANDGYEDSNTATVNAVVGVSPGASISASGAAGVYLIPVVLGTDAGEFKVHFNAIGVPDRVQILFDDANETSNDLSSMQVVADSLFIGDYVAEDTSPFDVPANGTTSNLDLFTYNGSSFDTTETGTQSITITDSDVAANTGTRSDISPDGPSRNGSSGSQLGVQNLVYTSIGDTTGASDLNYADGNICLTYLKGTTTAYTAYIRVYGVTGTQWDIYQTEFDTAV